MNQVLGVSSANDALLFHLGDKVHVQRCYKPKPEVEALAAHLNRLVTHHPDQEPETPPHELVQIVNRQPETISQ